MKIFKSNLTYSNHWGQRTKSAKYRCDLTGERMLKSLNKFLTSNYTKCKPWGKKRATIGCKGEFCSATWVSCRWAMWPLGLLLMSFLVSSRTCGRIWPVISVWQCAELDWVFRQKKKISVLPLLFKIFFYINYCHYGLAVNCICIIDFFNHKLLL